MAYNPFEVRTFELYKLSEHDLTILITDKVCEGYWVEYKSAFPENAKIAKSIASFANTYGGWYFIGIEADKIGNAAIKLEGFSLEVIPNPIDRLRETIKSYIDPTPEFYATVVTLLSGQAILVVYVPDDQETPFVHRDGRIYRRIADSSDPIAETNRHAVDRLFDQGKAVSDKFVQFCQDERAFGANENTRWVNIYISPYPLIEIDGNNEDSFASRVSRYKELSLKPVSIRSPNGEEIATANVPFWSAQPTTCSVILRQTNPLHLLINSLEVELYFDGRARFFIPLEQIKIVDRQALESLRSSRLRNWLTSLVQDDRDAFNLVAVRMDRLWLAIMTLSSYYQHWYSQEIAPIGAHNSQFRIAVHILNVADTIAIVDSDDFVKHAAEYGLPLINRNSIQWPRDIRKPVTADITDAPLWLLINGAVMMELGLPDSLIEAVLEAAFSSLNNNISKTG